MFALPLHVVSSHILPALSMRDLQALDTAVTNKRLRSHLQTILKSYTYTSTEYISFSNLQWLVDKGTDVVSARCKWHDEIVLVPAHLPMLKSVWLSCRIMFLPPGTEDDYIVTQIARSCPALEEFRCPVATVSDTSISVLAYHCRMLKSIDLSECNVTDDAIKAFCRYCPFVEDVYLKYMRGISNDSLFTVANAYPHLKSLQLHCEGVTDEGYIRLAERCHQLRVIKLHRVSAISFLAICKSNPFLTHVDLDECGIDDNSLLVLSQECKSLQSLAVTFCCAVTDAGWEMFVENSRSLSELYVATYHTTPYNYFSKSQIERQSGCAVKWVYEVVNLDDDFEDNNEELVNYDIGTEYDHDDYYYDDDYDIGTEYDYDDYYYDDDDSNYSMYS